VAEYAAGEDAEAGQEGGEDESDGSCDALKILCSVGSLCYLSVEFAELLIDEGE